MKLILWIMFTSALATTGFAQYDDSQSWNHLTCFYRTQGTVTSLRYVQYANESFDFITGDIKLLAYAWTTKRPEFNIGYCSRMISVGSSDSAIIKSIKYKGPQITKIGEDCNATGENIEVVLAEQKVVPRGGFVSYEVPWDKPFDSAKFIEYIPTVEEAKKMPTISWQKCLDLLPN